MRDALRETAELAYVIHLKKKEKGLHFTSCPDAECEDLKGISYSEEHNSTTRNFRRRSGWPEELPYQIFIRLCLIAYFTNSTWVFRLSFCMI